MILYCQFSLFNKVVKGKRNIYFGLSVFFLALTVLTAIISFNRH